MYEIRETCLSETPALAEILAIAENEPYLHGFVDRNEPNRKRIAVFADDVIVGFLTPRIENHYWRIGATYFSPEFRKASLGYSLAAEVFNKYFSGLPVVEVVDKTNERAKRFLSSCGMHLYKLHSNDTEIWINTLSTS